MYKKGEIIEAGDIGKALTNNTTEVTYYKIFAITIRVNNAYNCTFLFNANSNTT